MSAKLRVVPQTETEEPRQPAYVAAGDDLWLNTKTGVYYVRQYFRRHRIPDLFQSTREKDRKKAKQVAKQLVAEHWNRYLGGDPTDPLHRRKGKQISSVIEEIFLTVAPRKRASTQENYRTYLNELKREWGSWDLSRMTLAAYQTWLNDFRRRKKRTTYADYAKYLNLIFRYAYRHRYISHLMTFPNPDEKKGSIGRVFSPDEISRLWKHMNEDTRDQFVLSYECFMRLREALHLTWTRVDFQEGVIILRPEDVKTGSKTGRGRVFKLSPRALKRLKARRRRYPRSTYVFPSPVDPGRPVEQNKFAWTRAKSLAKIKGRARWHDLRHSALSHALLDQKLPPVLVSEYAGVSIRTIQQVYLHSTAEKTASVALALSIPVSRRGFVVNRKEEGEE